MFRKHAAFIGFTFLFVLISNWHLFYSSFTAFGKSSQPYTRIENEKLTTFIQDQTGVQVSSFFLLPSDSLFAGMSGIPSRPVMTISRALYDSFSKEELEYIVLHETGHYALWHPLTEILLQTSIVVTAFFMLRLLAVSQQTKFLLAVCAGCVFGILAIQVARQFERQADTYALERLENPQAMIDATRKLQIAWKGPKDSSLWRSIFYRARKYSKRIEQAESLSK